MFGTVVVGAWRHADIFVHMLPNAGEYRGAVVIVGSEIAESSRSPGYNQTEPRKSHPLMSVFLATWPLRLIASSRLSLRTPTTLFFMPAPAAPDPSVTGQLGRWRMASPRSATIKYFMEVDGWLCLNCNSTSICIFIDSSSTATIGNSSSGCILCRFCWGEGLKTRTYLWPMHIRCNRPTSFFLRRHSQLAKLQYNRRDDPKLNRYDDRKLWPTRIKSDVAGRPPFFYVTIASQALSYSRIGAKIGYRLLLKMPPHLKLRCIAIWLIYCRLLGCATWVWNKFECF